MQHTIFAEICPMVVEKFFLSFFTINGHGNHLGHVTSIISLNLISLYLKPYIQNLVQNGPMVS